MRRKKGRGSLPRFLDDLLRAEKRRFLEKEFDDLGMAMRPLWYLSQVAFPLDADTAGAVQSLIDHFVLSWGLVESYIQEWAYPKFREDALAFSEAASDGRPPVPELETLRAFQGDKWGRRFLRLDTRPEEFEEVCLDTADLIQNGFFLDHPSLEGRYLRLPYVPLGDDRLSDIPLIDGCWLDQRLIELCETAAHLHQEGFTRVPPIDRHRVAWHRFFPPHTRWQGPRESPPERFWETLDKVGQKIRNLPARRSEVSGRTVVHIDDYAGWKGCWVPRDYLVADARHIGIPVRRWNDWIRQNGDGDTLDLFGTMIGVVEHPFDVGLYSSIAVHATMEQSKEAMGRRSKVVHDLVQLASYQPEPPRSRTKLTGRQRRILLALQVSGPMGGADLAAMVGCGRRDLYRAGGLGELKTRGLVTVSGRDNMQITEKGRAALNEK